MHHRKLVLVDMRSTHTHDLFLSAHDRFLYSLVHVEECKKRENVSIFLVINACVKADGGKILYYYATVFGSNIDRVAFPCLAVS